MGVMQAIVGADGMRHPQCMYGIVVVMQDNLTAMVVSSHQPTTNRGINVRWDEKISLKSVHPQYKRGSFQDKLRVVEDILGSLLGRKKHASITGSSSSSPPLSETLAPNRFLEINIAPLSHYQD